MSDRTYSAAKIERLVNILETLANLSAGASWESEIRQLCADLPRYLDVPPVPPEPASVPAPAPTLEEFDALMTVYEVATLLVGQWQPFEGPTLDERRIRRQDAKEALRSWVVSRLTTPEKPAWADRCEAALERFEVGAIAKDAARQALAFCQHTGIHPSRIAPTVDGTVMVHVFVDDWHAYFETTDDGDCRLFVSSAATTPERRLDLCSLHPNCPGHPPASDAAFEKMLTEYGEAFQDVGFEYSSGTKVDQDLADQRLTTVRAALLALWGAR